MRKYFEIICICDSAEIQSIKPYGSHAGYFMVRSFGAFDFINIRRNYNSNQEHTTRGKYNTYSRRASAGLDSL